MTWREKLNVGAPKRDRKATVELRIAQFGQVLNNYGRVLDLMADAAAKQGGEFILGKRFVDTLADDLFNIAKAEVFDCLMITGKRHLFFLDQLERFELETAEFLDRADNFRGTPDSHGSRTEIDPQKLAEAISKHGVLYHGRGQVAARGIGGGHVYNLESGANPDEFPEGGIWISKDLDRAVTLIPAIGKIRAILADRGHPADPGCRLARNFRVPALVGLGDVTTRLKTGDEVTVDADDNTVYQGLIPELLEYGGGLKASGEEDWDYQLLREFRRLVFPLTIANLRDHAPWEDDLKTPHDLIHLAHELAGEALYELIGNPGRLSAFSSEDKCGCVPVIRLNPDGGPVEDSPALSSFLRGVASHTPKGKTKAGKDKVIAAVMGRRVHLVMPDDRGFDMIDAEAGPNRESNYIYCRIGSRAWDLDRKFIRRDVALDVLTRLKFDATETWRALSGWSPRLEESEAESRLEILGALWALIKERDREGWDRGGIPALVDEFLKTRAGWGR